LTERSRVLPAVGWQMCKNNSQPEAWVKHVRTVT